MNKLHLERRNYIQQNIVVDGMVSDAFFKSA